MPRLFGYGPERGTFEHLAHKVKCYKLRILQATFYEILTCILYMWKPFLLFSFVVWFASQIHDV